MAAYHFDPEVSKGYHSLIVIVQNDGGIFKYVAIAIQSGMTFKPFQYMQRSTLYLSILRRTAIHICIHTLPYPLPPPLHPSPHALAYQPYPAPIAVTQLFTSSQTVVHVATSPDQWKTMFYKTNHPIISFYLYFMSSPIWNFSRAVGIPVTASRLSSRSGWNSWRNVWLSLCARQFVWTLTSSEDTCGW